MSSRVEVEPPEDMDHTEYIVDPRMRIWKNMVAGQDERHPKAEEDRDELHHPSVADLQVQSEKLGDLPVADIQIDPFNEMKYDQRPEGDKDDIHHPAVSGVALEEPEQDYDEVYHKTTEELRQYLVPLMANYKAVEEASVMHSEPESDKDGVYHGDDPPAVYKEPPRHVFRSESEVRVHLFPEEDMDDVYHKDALQPVPQRGDPKAATYNDVPSRNKHSKPEEDLDHLYHQ